jgi:hypothetical protein
MWRQTILVGGIACLLSACSSQPPSAIDEARTACKLYLPSATAQGTHSVSKSRRVLQLVRQAAQHAARAASIDSRWNRLNDDESAMLDAWQYDVDVILPLPRNKNGQPEISPDQITQYSTLLEHFRSAASSARAECAKARA